MFDPPLLWSRRPSLTVIAEVTGDGRLFGSESAFAHGQIRVTVSPVVVKA
jgi:hypothetical protein